VLVREHCPIIFCQFTELVVGVLKSQISQLNLVDHLFSQLRIHRHVDELRLFGHFLFKVKLSSSETHLVHAYNDEFSSQPDIDLFFWLAHSCKSTIVALFKEQDKRAGPRRIVISLDSDLINVNALEFLVVETKVSSRVRMRLKKGAVRVRLAFDMQLSWSAIPGRQLLEVDASNASLDSPTLVVGFEDADRFIFNGLAVAVVRCHSKRILQTLRVLII